MLNQYVRTAGGVGAPAAILTSKQQMERLVMANLLWEDNFYSDGKSSAQAIRELVPYCGTQDLIGIAIRARENQKLRKVPLFIAVQMLKHAKHKSEVRFLLPRIISRADMILDFLDMYATENDGKVRPLANAAIDGLALSFNQFTEYSFGKYNNSRRNINFQDAIRLCHPIPVPAKKELFEKIANDKLATPETWETMLSAGVDKNETWTKLIMEQKIGGLAFLRNLHNMVRANVSDSVIEYGFNTLKSSMLLPTNFFIANQEAPAFSSRIEEAMANSYTLLPKLLGHTLFIIDVSGSMNCAISSRSKLSRLDSAVSMAILAVNQCESVDIICTAGSDHERIHASLMLDRPLKGFSLGAQIQESIFIVGHGGIFTAQVLEWAKTNYGGRDYKRIIVFSDSQDMDPSGIIPAPFAKYNYICDVSAERHGINYEGVWTAEISGWSEHFLTYISSLEGNDNSFSEE